jgi:hypothetical protein
MRSAQVLQVVASRDIWGTFLQARIRRMEEAPRGSLALLPVTTAARLGEAARHHWALLLLVVLP